MPDGLCKRTCGRLAAISGSVGNGQCKTLWIDFEGDGTIGRRARAKRATEARELGIPSTATPIDRDVFRIILKSVTTGQRRQVIRHAFQVEPAEATTIHQVQGGKEKHILVGNSKGMREAMPYVSISRPELHGGLHLERPLTLVDLQPNKKVSEFMEWMHQHKTLKLCVSTLEEFDAGWLVGVAHNARSLRLHMPEAAAEPWAEFGPGQDPWTHHVDWLAYTESHCLDTDAELSRLHQAFPERQGTCIPATTIATNSRARGTALITHNEKTQWQLQAVKPSELIEVIISRSSELTAVSVYRSPKADLTPLLTLLQQLRRQYPGPTIVAGDFNSNGIPAAADPEYRWLQQIMATFGLTQLVTEATTPQGTMIDHVWSNVPATRCKMGTLASVWSDHAPVWWAVRRDGYADAPEEMDLEKNIPPPPGFGKTQSTTGKPNQQTR